MAPAMASSAVSAANSAGLAAQQNLSGQLVLICTPDGTRLVALPGGNDGSGNPPAGAMQQGCPFCLVAAHSAGALDQPPAIIPAVRPSEFQTSGPDLQAPPRLIARVDHRLHPAQPRAPPALIV
jgi:hypothetical protein